MNLPDAFVWSRIGAEAGLSVQAILRWKELQRQLGAGLFYWGIGSKVRTDKIREADRRCGKAVVLFSMQPSPAQRHDKEPAEVCLWTCFVDNTGTERQLPDHACVTSNALKVSGEPKSEHYALVCYSAHPLRLEKGIPFDVGTYRNLNGKKNIGQGTVVVERRASPENIRAYDEGFLATLQAPHRLTLKRPKNLTAHQVKRQKELMASKDLSPDEFEAFLRELRG